MISNVHEDLEKLIMRRDDRVQGKITGKEDQVKELEAIFRHV